MSTALESDFLELMVETVRIEKLVGVDQYNQPTYGQVGQYRCRIEYRNKAVRTPAKLETVSSCQIYLATPVGTRPVDRVTLPDGTQPPILSVERQADPNGPYYEVIFTA